LNLNDHSKYQNFKKIHLLGTKLLVKIKLELANAEVCFVYTSHSQKYTGYLSTVDPKQNSLKQKKGKRKETLTTYLKLIDL
jgi:hypothetical protein